MTYLILSGMLNPNLVNQLILCCTLKCNVALMLFWMIRVCLYLCSGHYAELRSMLIINGDVTEPS